MPEEIRDVETVTISPEGKVTLRNREKEIIKSIEPWSGEVDIEIFGAVETKAYILGKLAEITITLRKGVCYISKENNLIQCW